MNSEEPNLQQHLNETRSKIYLEPEGIGLSNIIFAGKLRSEGDISDGLNLHRKIVEEEVDNSEANITGILMGQVCSIYLLMLYSLSFISYQQRVTAFCTFSRDHVDQF